MDERLADDDEVFAVVALDSIPPLIPLAAATRAGADEADTGKCPAPDRETPGALFIVTAASETPSGINSDSANMEIIILLGMTELLSHL
jgi:hypothetical protein